MNKQMFFILFYGYFSELKKKKDRKTLFLDALKMKNVPRGERLYPVYFQTISQKKNYINLTTKILSFFGGMKLKLYQNTEVKYKKKKTSNKETE